MKTNAMLTLVNPNTGELALSIRLFDGTSPFNFLQRLNFYTILWVREGQGTYKVDFSEHKLRGHSMLFFTPYQPFMLLPKENFVGVAIHFHSDFFCIEKHKEEVACNGVLFNNIYSAPMIELTEDDEFLIEHTIETIQREMDTKEIAHDEMLIAQLKILLVEASRLKIAQSPGSLAGHESTEIPLVKQFQKHIENHFRSKHSPGDYASLLNITPKSLGRITKLHYDKTPSDLIHERIIIEAKRELYLTFKSVKEIAYSLGFEDEHHFSRFFKNATTVSPQLYRQSVGSGRGELVSKNYS